MAAMMGASQSQGRSGAARTTNIRHTTVMVPATSKLAIAHRGQISRKSPMRRRRRSRPRSGPRSDLSHAGMLSS